MACRTWRNEQGGPIVVLESTGVYWKPISHVLVEALEVVVANARSVRQRPGKKTDQADAAWLAELLAHGLVEPRFLPPPAIQAWRDLTRTRVALVQTRTQGQNRLSTVLADTNIKVAHAMSDLFGNSGRRMLKALCAGERDPEQLAALALGTWRRKLPELELAWTGQCTAHHGRLIQGALALMELLARQIATLDEQIRQARRPVRRSWSRSKVFPASTRSQRVTSSPRSAWRRVVWLGHAAVGVGRRLAGQQRECGETTARDARGRAIGLCVGSWCSVRGRRARRQRLSGGRCAAEKSSGAEESRHGSGA